MTEELEARNDAQAESISCYESELIKRDKLIEELKDDNKACKFAMAMSEKVEKQLREQIEKMKCCDNCKHPYWNAETEAEETICDNCVNNNNWELAE